MSACVSRRWLIAHSPFPLSSRGWLCTDLEEGFLAIHYMCLLSLYVTLHYTDLLGSSVHMGCALLSWFCAKLNFVRITSHHPYFSKLELQRNRWHPSDVSPFSSSQVLIPRPLAITSTRRFSPPPSYPCLSDAKSRESGALEGTLVVYPIIASEFRSRSVSPGIF